MSNQCDEEISRTRKRVSGGGRGGPQQAARPLRQTGRGQRQPARHAAPHRRRAGQSQQPAHELPQVHRLALGDEVGAARGARARREPLHRQRVRFRGAVDVGHVDAKRTAPDPHQAPAPGAGDQRRHQVAVAGAPDQVRAQRRGGQRAVVGRQHRLLRQGLGPRIGRVVVVGIGYRLIDAAQVAAGEHHARRAGEHQPLHPVGAAAGDYRLGAGHVYLVEAARGARSAGYQRRGVHYRPAAGAGRGGGARVRQVAAHLLHAAGRQRRVAAPRVAAHLMAAAQQPLHHGASQEAAAAGHQHLHGAA